MARLSADQWESVRAKREAGMSFEALAREFGVSKTAVVKKAKKGGWSDGSDVQDVIRRKVSEKVSGIVTAANPEKRAEAIDAEAERRASVRLRHRKECEQVAALRQEAINHRVTDVKEAFEKAKLAKIMAESLSIQHACESRAWGLDVVDYDLSKLSDEQLQQLIKGRAPR